MCPYNSSYLAVSCLQKLVFNIRWCTVRAVNPTFLVSSFMKLTQSCITYIFSFDSKFILFRI